jgi:hypothetical protein
MSDEKGMVIVLDEHYVLYAPPAEIAFDMRHLRQWQDTLRAINADRGWPWEFLVIPGPVEVHDFRDADLETMALAKRIRARLDKEKAP